MPGRTSARRSDSYLSASSTFVQPCQILLIIRCPSLSFPLPSSLFPLPSSPFPLPPSPFPLPNTQFSGQEVSHSVVYFHRIGVTHEVMRIVGYDQLFIRNAGRVEPPDQVHRLSNLDVAVIVAVDE